MLGAIYVINIFMEFVTGIVAIHKFNKVKIMDGRFIAKNYFLSFGFVVDLFTVAPFMAEVKRAPTV